MIPTECDQSSGFYNPLDPDKINNKRRTIMTAEKIWVEAIVGATGQPKQVIKEKVANIRKMMPEIMDWDKEKTGPELEQLLKGLKAEAPAIRGAPIS